jgi:hypothetical protein
VPILTLALVEGYCLRQQQSEDHRRERAQGRPPAILLTHNGATSDMASAQAAWRSDVRRHSLYMRSQIAAATAKVVCNKEKRQVSVSLKSL